MNHEKDRFTRRLRWMSSLFTGCQKLVCILLLSNLFLTSAKIIQILLNKGEDPTIEDKRGNSPLQLFVKWNTISVDMIDDYRWEKRAAESTQLDPGLLDFLTKNLFRRVLRIYLECLEKKYGSKAIDKIYSNGNACLHTASES